jgi:hypothetical protein
MPIQSCVDYLTTNQVRCNETNTRLTHESMVKTVYITCSPRQEREVNLTPIGGRVAPQGTHPMYRWYTRRFFKN